MTGIKLGRILGPSDEASLKKVLLVGVGLVLLLAGVIFTFQGSGAMGGSGMSGVTFWAIAGPVIALVGLVLAVLGLRGGRARSSRHDRAGSSLT
jgi:NADH:ubiquinone oxidoreductase subunit 2 (subunit N)